MRQHNPTSSVRKWQPADLTASAVVFLFFALFAWYADRLPDLLGYVLPPRAGLMAASVLEAWVLVFGTYCLFRVARAFRQGSVSHLVLLGYLGGLLGLFGIVYSRIPTGIWIVTALSALVFGIVYYKDIVMRVLYPRSVEDYAFSVGDWITVYDSELHERLQGLVTATDYRTTHLVDDQGRPCTLPNRLLSGAAVASEATDGRHARFETQVVLDPAVPIDRAMRVLEAGALAAVRPGGPVKNPAPAVSVQEIGERGVTFNVAYSIDLSASAKVGAQALLVRSLVEHVQQSGLSLMGGSTNAAGNEVTRSMDVRTLEGRMATLAGIELFENLDTDALAEIARHMKAILFKKGHTIMREGDSGHSMFVLVEGLLQVYKRSPDAAGLIGVGKIHPRYFFGEMSLLTGQPRSATVVAETDSVSMEIRREDISDLLIRRPEIALKVGMVAAERRMKNLIELGQYEPRDLQRQTAQVVSHILAEMRAFFGSAPATAA